MPKPSAVVLPRRLGLSAIRSILSSSASSAKDTNAFALSAAASELTPEERLHKEPPLDLPRDTSSTAANSSVAEVVAADSDASRASSSATAVAARVRSSPSPTPPATPNVGWSSTPSSLTNPRDLLHRRRFHDPQRRVVVDAPTSPESQVAAAAADGGTPLSEPIAGLLYEIHGDRGVSPRSERLLAALAKAATFELATVTTARTCRAAFSSKVCVAVLATTLAFVIAVDFALAVHLLACRADDVVPPPT